jgi:hypothetical protein
MRTRILAALCVTGIVAIAAAARASGQTKAGASSKTVAPAKVSAPASSTSGASGTRTSPAGATTLKTQSAASDAKQPATNAAASAAATGADSGKQETLEEIVARVRRRLEMERAPKRNVRATPRNEPTPRVTLVWRPYVVWPDELTDDTQAAAADQERVTLQWHDEQ